MWSLYSEINNFIKNESRNIAVKSSVSDSFQYVSSYEETTSTFSVKKLVTSLCCLVNKSNLFISKPSLRWTQAGETDWHTLVPSTLMHSIPILLQGWLKQGSVNRSHFKWSWSKLLSQTEVKTRQGLKGKERL